MRYILGLLLLPVIAVAQTTTPLINKTTKVWVSPTAAEIATANFYGLTTNPLSQFAATTSAQFAGVISDETGTGAVVLGTSPVFTTSISTPSIVATDDLTINTVGNDINIASGDSLNFTNNDTISFANGHLRGSTGNNSIQFVTNGVSFFGNGAERFRVQSGGLLVMVNGSLSAPALVLGGSQAGSANTGLYSVSADEVAASGDGTGIWGWDGTSFFFGPTGTKRRFSHTDSGADEILFFDDSASAYVGLTLSGLTITATTLSVDAATESAAGKAELSTQAEAEAGTNDTTAMTPLKVNQRIANTARLIYNDTKTSGTAGGTFTSGAWQTRTLNTEVIDTESIGTLSGNEITLPVGTYIIRWSCPAFAVGLNQSRLYGVSDIAASAYGTNSRSGNSDSTMSISSGVAIVTITLGSKTYRIEHQCETTVATTGFGNSMGFGSDEIYTTVDIQKID